MNQSSAVNTTFLISTVTKKAPRKEAVGSYFQIYFLDSCLTAAKCRCTICSCIMLAAKHNKGSKFVVYMVINTDNIFYCL